METYGIQDERDKRHTGYTPDEMSTGERTGAAKLKWVVIVYRSLSPGQAVNAAVCVAGRYLAWKSPGCWVRAVPTPPDPWGMRACPGRAARSSPLLRPSSAPVRQQAIDRHLLAADMPAAAQATRVYDDYLAENDETHPDDLLALLAVSLIGPRNQVAKLVRHLELLP